MTHFIKLAHKIDETVHNRVWLDDVDELREAASFLRRCEATDEDINGLRELANHYGSYDVHEVAARNGLELIEIDDSFDSVTIVLKCPETGNQWTNVLSYHSLIDVDDAEAQHQILFHHDSPWRDDSLLDDYAHINAVEYSCESVSCGQEPDERKA